ncbi:MAG: carboxypeptidase-like regulatory domain-containing protein [Thermofilaceae archaeon]
MKATTSTTLITVIVVVALSGITFPQPIALSIGINDVAYDGGQLYLSLTNGTLVSYSGEAWIWRLTFEGYGIPVFLTPAPPYGLLVLTDAAWLGLIARDGRPMGWAKVSIDPNAVARGRGKLLYANGLALIYAGGTASAVKVPELKPLDYYSIRNTFLGGSISSRGDAIVLYGFDTFCSICIQNEEKLLLIIKPETGDLLFRGVVTHLRDAAVFWRRNWLILAKWDAMYVYNLEDRGLEKPVRVYAYAQPIDRWLSWGFSPSGNLFHYIFASGNSLSLVVVDIESGSTISRDVPLTPARRVLSSIDDNYRLAILSYNTVVEAAYVVFSDATGGMLMEALRDLGTPRAIRIAVDRTIALFDRGFVVMPPLVTGTTREESKLAHLVVQVIDEEGQPFHGALVCANTSCVTTSSTGVAELALEPGTYLLTVRHSLAQEFQTSFTIQGNLTKLVTLRRLYSLNVNVNVSTGKRLTEGCIIRVYDVQGTKLGEASNCTATFSLTRGLYAVEAEAAQQVVKQIVAIQSDTLLNFLLIERPSFTLTVSVLDENGTALRDAFIKLLDSRNVTVASAQGKLVLQLAPGRYTVLVQKPGYLNWSSTLELSDNLSVETMLTRYPRTTVHEGEPDETRLVAASAASSLITATLVVAAQRFNLPERVVKQASRVSSKLRMKRSRRRAS